MLDRLKSAKNKLGRTLPPQADKILRAFQHVELALHYAQIDSGDGNVLSALRDALRALNQIDRPRELPAPIAVSVSTAIDDLVRSVRAIESRQARPAAGPAKQQGGYDGTTDRRRGGSESADPDTPKRRSDDTINLFACM
jgi:hypothetical protein